jgi:DNA-binding HxlR family transcriptional regulator
MTKADEMPFAICPSVQAAFDLLGKKWTGLVVMSLSGGERCFSELVKSVPKLSPRLLALRMKELEREGLATRRVDSGSPVRVAYALTEKGRALLPVMRGVADWARAWSPAMDREGPYRVRASRQHAG